MPDSLAALAAFDINFPDVGTSMRGIRFISETGSVSAEFPNGPGQAVRRLALHKALVEKASLAGVHLLWGVKHVQTRPGLVSFSGGQIECPLIIGADGQNSSVRREAGLEACVSKKIRYAFRQHFDVAPWSEYVEVYWGEHFQLYVTGVAPNQVCVALISNDPRLRLKQAIARIPTLSKRIKGASEATPERGALTVSRKLRRVWANGYGLVGDASGSVDAITGEGMCLGFKHASALVRALEANDMGMYQREHTAIGAKPMLMSRLLLLLDNNRFFQRKALQALESYPQVFRALLETHVGYKPLTDVFSWQLLAAGIGAIRA